MHALRASAQAFEYPVDIRAIRDPSVAVGVPGGGELIAFVDAVMEGSDELADRARERLVDALGEASLFDAATVYGNFAMMNRVAEATGIPISPVAIERERDMVEMLELDRFLEA